MIGEVPGRPTRGTEHSDSALWSALGRRSGWVRVNVSQVSRWPSSDAQIQWQADAVMNRQLKADSLARPG